MAVCGVVQVADLVPVAAIVPVFLAGRKPAICGDRYRTAVVPRPSFAWFRSRPAVHILVDSSGLFDNARLIVAVSYTAAVRWINDKINVEYPPLTAVRNRLFSTLDSAADAYFGGKPDTCAAVLYTTGFPACILVYKQFPACIYKQQYNVCSTSR